jgi:hypothetical protein
VIGSQRDYGSKTGCWRVELQAGSGKMKIARGNELPEKGVKITNEREMAVAWAQEMK